LPESPRTRFTQPRVVRITTTDSGKLGQPKRGKRKGKRKPRHELYHQDNYAWCHCAKWHRTPITLADAEKAFQRHLQEVEKS
jgi:hypothetical protein